MSVKSIYRLLRAAGMTREGACGLMGNMMAESGMKADNAQDAYGVRDDEYTAAADSGQNHFVSDAIGYGLCQWTLASRKQKLLDFARARGVSVADEEMQIRFCVQELREDFPGVWKLLTESGDLLACTREVLNVYENPAVKNLGARLEYARQAMAFFEGEDAAPAQSDADPYIAVLQMVMREYGYWEEPDGRKSPALAARLRDFADGLEAS